MALPILTSQITCSRKKSFRWWQRNFDYLIKVHNLYHMKQRMSFKLAANVLVSLSLKKQTVLNPPWLVILKNRLVYLSKSAMQVMCTESILQKIEE